MWEMGTWQRKLTLAHSEAVMCVAIGSDGHTVVSGTADGCVVVWNTITLERNGILRGHSGSVRAVAFSGCGRYVVSASDDGTCIVWEKPSFLASFGLRIKKCFSRKEKLKIYAL